MDMPSTTRWRDREVFGPTETRDAPFVWPTRLSVKSIRSTCGTGKLSYWTIRKPSSTVAARFGTAVKPSSIRPTQRVFGAALIVHRTRRDRAHCQISSNTSEIDRRATHFTRGVRPKTVGPTLNSRTPLAEGFNAFMNNWPKNPEDDWLRASSRMWESNTSTSRLSFHIHCH
ncbi:hypothetical protein BC567DRAFT_239315 [Phyllosticta citribraziliensis]